MHKHQIRLVVIRSPVLDAALILTGAALGWFLALTSQSVKRGMTETPDSPQPTPATPPAPKPAPFKPNISSLWKNGAAWSHNVDFAIDAAKFDDLVLGATLEDIKALQLQTLQSAQEAHAFAMDQFRHTQDPRFTNQALAINNQEAAFSQAMVVKALGLVGGDISQLQATAAELKLAGSALPEATQKLDAIDGYLNVFNKLLSLVS